MNETDVYTEETPLAALLERVERGEQVTITRHGRPVARLMPLPSARETNLDEVFAEMDRLRVGNRLGDLSTRELIEEGRR